MHPEIVLLILLRMKINRGEKIVLERTERKDIDGMLEWMHDPEIQKYFHIKMIDCIREDVQHFIRSAVAKPIEGKDIHYAIADDDDEYLGTIGLKHVVLTF